MDILSINGGSINSRDSSDTDKSIFSFSLSSTHWISFYLFQLSYSHSFLSFLSFSFLSFPLCLFRFLIVFFLFLSILTSYFHSNTLSLSLFRLLSFSFLHSLFLLISPCFLSYFLFRLSFFLSRLLLLVCTHPEQGFCKIHTSKHAGKHAPLQFSLLKRQIGPFRALLKWFYLFCLFDV